MEYKVKSVSINSGKLTVEFDTPEAQYMAENPQIVCERLLQAWKIDECLHLITLICDEVALMKDAEILLNHAKQLANNWLNLTAESAAS
jgi:hypothetical protein